MLAVGNPHGRRYARCPLRQDLLEIIVSGCVAGCRESGQELFALFLAGIDRLQKGMMFTEPEPLGKLSDTAGIIGQREGGILEKDAGEGGFEVDADRAG
jgi:hypothetical protein